MNPFQVITKIGSTIVDIEQSSYQPGTDRKIRTASTSASVTFLQRETEDEGILCPAKSLNLWITDAEMAQQLSAQFSALARAMYAKGVEE